MKEIRDEIIKRIETKKGSVGKSQSKADNLKSQRQMYVDAIADHEAKIEKLKALIAQRDANAEGHVEDSGLRAGEVDHMEQILARFDKAVLERENVVAKIQDVIASHPDWLPGMDENLKGGYARDPKYKKLTARRDYLDTVIEGALPDIKKIFYSRGVVSEINEKGRKGV